MQKGLDLAQTIDELTPQIFRDSMRLLKQDLDLTTCFTDEEVKELFKQPHQREYVGFRDLVAMTLLLDCGIRANELLSLRVSDIDFQTRFITLKAEVNKNRKLSIVPMSGYSVKLLIQLIGENTPNDNLSFSKDTFYLDMIAFNRSSFLLL